MVTHKGKGSRNSVRTLVMSLQLLSCGFRELMGWTQLPDPGRKQVKHGQDDLCM